MTASAGSAGSGVGVDTAGADDVAALLIAPLSPADELAGGAAGFVVARGVAAGVGVGVGVDAGSAAGLADGPELAAGALDVELALPRAGGGPLAATCFFFPSGTV